ncbi:hypothetical protein [Lentibacillus cibarius]|uniref:Uncharacterized protein n=1 Tax=Lentibacillus cibarius TaxID=2583219 RepID=A0A5S3QIU1_9BACI|nr:hypothetical protein [Lentibacillus cibarius]TMN21842.1 hypothetical protein FFL34_06735 [Lentibacillus cibarius]
MHKFHNTDIPNKLRNMTVEETLKELCKAQEGNADQYKKTMTMMLEQMEKQNKNMDRKQERIDQLSNELSQSTSKTNYDRLLEAFQQSDEKVLDITNEIIKRIQAFTDLKRNMKKVDDEADTESLDFVIDELRSLLEYTQYR